MKDGYKMNCQYCGAQLPNDAKFCLICGKPQQTTIYANEQKWETCEIEREVDVSLGSQLKIFLNFLLTFGFYGGGFGAKYRAKAIGTKGMYIIHETPYYKRVKEEQKAVEELVNRLVQDGWQSIGKGEQWFNYKFRRLEK
jgi:hypothetical protein